MGALIGWAVFIGLLFTMAISVIQQERLSKDDQVAVWISVALFILGAIAITVL